MTLYGTQVSLSIRDRRAFLLSQHGGTGLQPELIDAIVAISQEMDSFVFLDVGGNYGEWSLLLSKRASKVILIEPNPQLAELARRNFAQHQNVKVVEVALAASTGSATMYQRSTYSGGSSLWAEYLSSLDKKKWWGIGGMEAITVQTDSARNVINSELPALRAEVGVVVKIDVEGAEPLILPDICDFLAERDAWVLVVEFNPTAIKSSGFDPTEVFSILNKLGTCRIFNENKSSVRITPTEFELKEEPSVTCDLIVTPRSARQTSYAVRRE